MTRRAMERKSKRLLIYFVIGVVMIIPFFPVLWTFMTSFKSRIDAFSIPPKIFFNPTLKNYLNVLFSRDTTLPRSILNSLILTGGAVILSIVVGVPCAYALARLTFRGKKLLGFWYLFVRMAPPIGIVIPFFLMFQKFSLIDTHVGLIGVYQTLTLPLIVWLIISFIEELPPQIDEMAMIDGCSRLGVIVRIIIPTCKGGIVAAAIFAFVEAWNDFLYILILGGVQSGTATLAIYGYLTTEETMWGPLTASASLVVVPIIVLSVITQRHIIRGLTFGAVKG